MRVVVFGEGMIEERADAAFAWGGDVVNTAVYLARQGVTPTLLTAMGADAGCDAIVDAWKAQGIDTTHVLRDPTRTAGRYKITLSDAGERRFTYDRDRSAARAFFEQPGAEAALAWAAGADVLYLSGITLSIFTEGGRARIDTLARTVRSRGGQVVFDPNYRKPGWPSPEAARVAVEALAPAITLALPSLDDHIVMHGPCTDAEAAAAWLALGADEVVIKDGAKGALAVRGAESVTIPAATPARIVDTTAAGDAFNAGYIAARLVEGTSMAEAGARGASLAAAVIEWPGAIAPPHVGQRP